MAGQPLDISRQADSETSVNWPYLAGGLSLLGIWCLLIGTYVLGPMVRELVLMELPPAPLCREDCAGICPTCGADRNQATCDCEQDLGDPRWAGLDALRATFEADR